MQGDRNPPVVTALYVSSKMDHHYLVRDRSAQALDIVLVCRRACFKDLFGPVGDELLKALKKGGFLPGTENCIFVLEQCATQCGIAVEPAPAAKATAPLPAEVLPATTPLPGEAAPAKPPLPPEAVPATPPLPPEATATPPLPVIGPLPARMPIGK
jgi:hypothetical protein